MAKPPNSNNLNSVHYEMRISLKQNALKIDDYRPKQESVLGAGGRAFKSPRPDHKSPEECAEDLVGEPATGILGRQPPHCRVVA